MHEAISASTSPIEVAELELMLEEQLAKRSNGIFS